MSDNKIYLDLTSYIEFFEINKYAVVELFYFTLTVIFIIAAFFFFFFRKTTNLIKREKIYFSIFKSSSVIFTAIVFILHLTYLIWTMQGTEFTARNAVETMYLDIIRFGTFLYELILLLILYMVFKLLFFWKINKIEKSQT